ncbi:hypothetical protein SAMN05421752_103268 [Natronorubrum thiooxidans]|uniref:Uncharacterized protein n=1 Tax=Natronorubrum thiooxidans TaxID=308853 RepID=A0A1N7E7C2_9EURY|nr:hypothetical protein SAMN05421752_103268 [Natronorubrum thiooxidans]
MLQNLLSEPLTDPLKALVECVSNASPGSLALVSVDHVTDCFRRPNAVGIADRRIAVRVSENPVVADQKIEHPKAITRPLNAP